MLGLRASREERSQADSLVRSVRRSAQPRRALVLRYSAANLANGGGPQWEGMTPLQTAMAEPPCAAPLHSFSWRGPHTSAPSLCSNRRGLLAVGLLVQKQSLWLLLADPKLNCGRRYDNHDVRPRPDIAALITEEEAALAADPKAAGPEYVSWYERPR